MKNTVLALFMFPTVVANVCLAQQEQGAFEYPSSIICSPEKAIQMDLISGVDGDKISLPDHEFMHLANDVYSYSNENMSSPINLKAHRMHSDNALTLIGGGLAFTVALYQNRYFGMSMPSEYGLTKVGASGIAYEGACNIKWK